MASIPTGWARLAAAAILTAAAAGSVARFALAETIPPEGARPTDGYRAASRPAPRKPAAAAPARAIASIKPDAPIAPDAQPQPLVVRHIIDTGGALRFGDYFWDDRAAAGPLTITVDLKASVLSVFRGGDEIGTTAVIYGADAKQTPLGTFPILGKDRHHFSSTYNHAPMPYMLRLTRDGVSIHASEVAADYATHGCIGVPAGFAKRLFAIAQVGDRVIVTSRGLRADLPKA